MTTSEFLSAALYEDLTDAYSRVWEYLKEHPDRWRNISEAEEAALREAAAKRISKDEDDAIPSE